MGDMFNTLLASLPSREKLFYWAVVITAAAVSAYEGVDAAGL